FLRFRFLKNGSRRLSPAGETVTLFNYSADISETYRVNSRWIM
ncbi:MAG: hypothetical protein ACI8P0_006450, partial [Planctomycetaceae bacterium]